MIPGRARVEIGENPTVHEGGTLESIHERHFAGTPGPSHSPGKTGREPWEPRLAVRRGSHSAPCAQKRAVRAHTHEARGGNPSPTPRGRERRSGKGTPRAPSAKPQRAVQSFPPPGARSLAGCPLATVTCTAHATKWPSCAPRPPPGKKGTGGRVGFASVSPPEHPWFFRSAPRAVGG